MKNLLLRSSITLVSALALVNTAFAADFVVPVDMKNVGSGWTDAGVSCVVSGPALAQKSGYAKAPLVNGAFKGNVNVTVVLTAAEVPLAKTWYCALNAATANGGSSISGNGSNLGGYANQPGTPYKDHDNGTY